MLPTLMLALAVATVPAQAVGRDSCGSWPRLTDTYPELDPSKVVSDPGTGIVFYRTDLLIRFQPGTTVQAKCALFARDDLTVTGETFTGGFFVKLPDPQSWERFDSLVSQMRHDSLLSVVLRLDTAPPELIVNNTTQLE